MMPSVPCMGFHKDRQQQCYEINNNKTIPYLNQQTFLLSETLAFHKQKAKTTLEISGIQKYKTIAVASKNKMLPLMTLHKQG